MRNAATVLGLIAGIIGIFVGMFGFGWVSLTQQVPEAGPVSYSHLRAHETPEQCVCRSQLD